MGSKEEAFSLFVYLTYEPGQRRLLPRREEVAPLHHPVALDAECAACP